MATFLLSAVVFQYHVTPTSKSSSSWIMSTLFALPPRIVELEICRFLDAASLTRFSCANRELHVEISCSQHWATHVTRNFGIAAHKLETGAPVASPPLTLPLSSSSTRMHSSPSKRNSTIQWRDVFVAACVDALALASALQDHDVLCVYHRQPPVLLSRLEAQIRDEIVLMHGLRRFPASSALLRLYAHVIRQKLL